MTSAPVAPADALPERAKCPHFQGRHQQMALQFLLAHGQIGAKRNPLQCCYLCVGLSLPMGARVVIFCDDSTERNPGTNS